MISTTVQEQLLEPSVLTLSLTDKFSVGEYTLICKLEIRIDNFWCKSLTGSLHPRILILCFLNFSITLVVDADIRVQLQHTTDGFVQVDHKPKH